MLGVDTVAEELILRDQTDLLGHPLEQETQFFHPKRLFDVVVGAELHRVHRRLDGAVAGHNGNFAPRQNGFDLAEEFHTRKVGEPQVGHHDVGRLCFEREQRRFGAFGLGASESEVGADGHTQAADALFIVYNQKADA